MADNKVNPPPEPEQMTPERLKEIEERCKKASAGPWFWRKCYEIGSGERHWALKSPESEANKRVIGIHGTLSFDHFTPPEKWNKDPNNQFIAHARTDIPDLLAEVRRLAARPQPAPSCCGDAHLELQAAMTMLADIGFERETIQRDGYKEHVWRNRYMLEPRATTFETKTAASESRLGASAQQGPEEQLLMAHEEMQYLFAFLRKHDLFDEYFNSLPPQGGGGAPAGGVSGAERNTQDTPLLIPAGASGVPTTEISECISGPEMAARLHQIANALVDSKKRFTAKIQLSVHCEEVEPKEKDNG